MSTTLYIILVTVGAVMAYLIGSINPAIIISKFLSGEDIRDMGSGNAGMTNVMRNYGKKAGAFTLVADTVKGMLTIIVMNFLLRGFGLDDNNYHLLLFAFYIAGLFAIFGHIFPVFYKFKGGKGIGVTLGTLLLLDIRVALTCLAVFLLVLLISKMVSLGSICAAVTLPLITLVLDVWLFPVKMGWWNTLVALIMGAIMIAKHGSNIARILNGTESKIGNH